METKVNKLERENKQLQTKWTEAKDIADKIDDFSNERERIKSELEAVRKENEELHIIKGLFVLYRNISMFITYKIFQNTTLHNKN